MFHDFLIRIIRVIPKMKKSIRMTNLSKWGIAVIILCFGILWLNTIIVVEVKFKSKTLSAVSGQTVSMYQSEHPNFLNYFQERKKLFQFACKHARKLYADAYEYTHKVYYTVYYLMPPTRQLWGII